MWDVREGLREQPLLPPRSAQVVQPEVPGRVATVRAEALRGAEGNRGALRGAGAGGAPGPRAPTNDGQGAPRRSPDNAGGSPQGSGCPRVLLRGAAWQGAALGAG